MEKLERNLGGIKDMEKIGEYEGTIQRDQKKLEKSYEICR